MIEDHETFWDDEPPEPLDGLTIISMALVVLVMIPLLELTARLRRWFVR
jgi:hypothetical protein